MDAINEFFRNLATKLKLPAFFKGNTLILNNLFLAAIVLVLVIVLILVIVLVPSKKKKEEPAAKATALSAKDEDEEPDLASIKPAEEEEEDEVIAPAPVEEAEEEAPEVIEEEPVEEAEEEAAPEEPAEEIEEAPVEEVEETPVEDEAAEEAEEEPAPEVIEEEPAEEAFEEAAEEEVPVAVEEPEEAAAEEDVAEEEPAEEAEVIEEEPVEAIAVEEEPEEEAVIEEAPVEEEPAPEVIEEEPVAEEAPIEEEVKEESEEIAVAEAEPTEEAPAEEPVTEETAKEEPAKKAPAKQEKKAVAPKASKKPVKNEIAAAKESGNMANEKEVKAKKPETKTVGKYEILERKGSFYFLLKANNGQLLAESPSYTTEVGAKKAIETFKNAVISGEWTIDEDKNGNFRFILKASSRSQMRYYGEAYSTRQSAESSIQSVKKFAQNAIVKVVENTDTDAIAANDSATVFVPDPITEKSYKAGGKYEIIERSGNFYFILKANNGQLLLESPSFTSENGAKNGIETFKKAVEAGIYTIDEDKNGNFKFILRASSRSQIRYFGESYTTRQRAESSVNSVRSFAQKAILKKPE